jgi:uncharacterized protein DUF6412
MFLAGVLFDVARLPVSPAALIALVMAGAFVAMVVLAAQAVGTSRTAAALPMLRRVAALREKSWRVAFLRQRDPDSAGHARPRAPSAASAAASC